MLSSFFSFKFDLWNSNDKMKRLVNRSIVWGGWEKQLMCSFSDVICRCVTYNNVKSRNIDNNIKPLSTGSSGSSRNARYSRRQQVGKLSYSEQIAWSQILDASCRLHPGSTYVTLSWVFPHNLHFSFFFYYYYYYYYYYYNYYYYFRYRYHFHVSYHHHHIFRCHYPHNYYHHRCNYQISLLSLSLSFYRL